MTRQTEKVEEDEEKMRDDNNEQEEKHKGRKENYNEKKYR